MSNEQRARDLLMKIWDAPDRETGVALIAAAKVEYEREALERAAKWHDNLAAQSRKEARQKDEEGWFQKGKDARENARWHEHFAFAIRALPPEPAASVTHSASCNISEKLSDVCSCGADPAAPDPAKALARLFMSGIKTGNAGYLFVRQLARDHGLLDGDPLWQEPPPLTEAGRAALRLAEDGE